jgi:uncharacterized repeat protein (TIGR02543 family)
MLFISKKLFLSLTIVLTLFITILVIAGTDLTKNTVPEPSMYTLEDIYNLIHEVGPAAEGDHDIYPGSNPTATTSYSVSQIYADLANLIKRENVATGTVYLGVTGSYGTPDPDYATTTVIASSLTPQGSAGAVWGYSLDDIYELITNNATTTAGAHDATPTTPPASSMHSLTDIYDALVNLIDDTQVRSGVVYLGVTGTYEPDFLISNWKMDGDVSDSFGNNDLTLAGNASLTTGLGGEANTAYSFDGTDDYLYCTDADCGGVGKLDYIYGTGWTWGEWIYPNTLGQSGKNSLLMGNRNSANNKGWNMVLSPDGFGCQIWTSTGGNCGAYVSGQISISTWSHVMCTHDGSKITLYINGEEVNTSSSNCSGLGSDSEGEFRIGKDNHSASNKDYNGKVDEVRVYSKALSAADIQDIYNSERPSYTVIFDGQGGFPDFSTTTDILSGSTITLPTEPTNDGYTFDGWYTEIDGGGTFFDDSTPVVANITVYAKWTEIAVDACGVSGDAADPDCWSELSNSMVWGPADTVAGASSTSDGRVNTDLLSGLAGDYPAADYCAGIEEGGYTDWYLPAKDELLEGRVALGLDMFPVNDYWSSSEGTDTPSNKAWELFSAGPSIYENSKQFMDLVRCLR